MKVQFTLPTDDSFFNRYATLIPALSKLGFVAQIISGITEIGILYAIFYSRLSDLFPDFAFFFSSVGALLLALLIEIGLRKLTPYSIRAFLYKRISGLDLAMTIVVLSMNILLLSVSGVLSFQGSKDLVEIAAPEPEQQSTATIDSGLVIQKVEIIKKFSADSATIASNYNPIITTKKDHYTALIEAQENIYKNYVAKEIRTNKSYRSAKERITKKIKKLQAEKNGIIAVQEEQKANEIKALFQDKQNQLFTASNLHQTERTKIENSNLTTLQTAKNKTKGYGNFLAYFTVICLFVLVFCITIDEINKKGSGIEQQAMPNQYHFSDSIFNEFSNMLGDGWNHALRSQISKWSAKIPAPPLPEAPTPLYEFGNLQQPRLKVEMKTPEQDIIYVESNYGTASAAQQLANNPSSASLSEEKLKAIQQQATDYLKASIELEKAKLHEQAKEMALKADDVIICYLGDDASPRNIKQLRTQIVGFLNGENENPFLRHHNRAIGFKKTTPQQTEKTAQQQPAKTAETLLEQGTNTVFIKDDKTIEHIDKNTGETKYYSLPQVKNFVSNYKSRVKLAAGKYEQLPSAGNLRTLESRKASLAYWEGKKGILESRVGG